MSHSSLRKPQLLVLRGDQLLPAADADNAAHMLDMLRADSRIQTTVTAAGFGQAVQAAQAQRPDVILLDGMLGDPAEVVSELDEALSDVPVLVLLDESDRNRIHACVVAGARGCMTRPVDTETLVTSILQIHAKVARRRKADTARNADGSKGGHVIAVRGAKGGVGATLIATNLAIAIQRRANSSIALIDGHFFGGDVPVMLDVTPARSIADLIPHLDRLDDDLLGSSMAKHGSGVAVLAAPHEFEQAESIRSDDYQRVLDAVRSRYDFVVVDCSPFLDQNSITAMDLADTLLLVSTPDVPALKNAARVVQLGAQLGYSRSKLRLVINRYNAPNALAPSEFERHLEYATSFRIPNDGNVGKTLTYGQPLVTSNRGAPASRAVDRLARTIIADDGWEGEAARKPRRAPLRFWPARRSSQTVQLQATAEAAA